MENRVNYVYQPHIKTFFWTGNFYRQHQKEIVQWCKQYGCNMPSKDHGWVECPDDKTVTMFVLRWPYTSTT